MISVPENFSGCSDRRADQRGALLPPFPGRPGITGRLVAAGTTCATTTGPPPWGGRGWQRRPARHRHLKLPDPGRAVGSGPPAVPGASALDGAGPGRWAEFWKRIGQTRYFQMCDPGLSEGVSAANVWLVPPGGHGVRKILGVFLRGGLGCNRGRGRRFRSVLARDRGLSCAPGDVVISISTRCTRDFGVAGRIGNEGTQDRNMRAQRKCCAGDGERIQAKLHLSAGLRRYGSGVSVHVADMGHSA